MLESAIRTVSIVVIGLGHQSVDDHLPAIRESSLIKLVGVVDVDLARAEAVGTAEGVPFATDTESLLAELDSQPNAALIAVPHSGYLPIIEKVARRGIHIIKEKPFATSFDNAVAIRQLIADNDVTLQVTLQRRFNPIYRSFEQLIKRIGRIHSIEARYTMNVERLDEGWRASRLFAGGGALIDLGYHYIDLIVWYFGLPDSVMCKLSTGNRDGQVYDVEDTAMLQFSYNTRAGGTEAIHGSFLVSRVYPDKDELLVAYGSKGSVAVRRGRVVRRAVDGSEIECLERTGSWPSALVDQLEEFALRIIARDRCGYIEDRYLQQAALVEAAYESARTGEAQNPYTIFEQLRG